MKTIRELITKGLAALGIKDSGDLVEKAAAIIAVHVEREYIELAKTVPIAKVDEERRLVYGVVYEPGVPDTYGDTMTEDEIEKSSHGFMVRYAFGSGQTGTDHAKVAKRSEMTVVESYIALVDFQLGAQTVTKGTWVMVAKVHDDDMWLGVKSGQFTGWSFEGRGLRVPDLAAA